ncbi:nucleotide sugar dehydrogenase [bacterium]|nr:nucleotide sugar dehydrogenase [bacterium]
MTQSVSASARDEMIAKIQQRKAIVGVVGLGYVGLPLVIEFARQGFDVEGFDIDPQKVECLADGRSYIKHISNDSIAELKNTGRFHPTTDYSLVTRCDAILLCVPTPLTRNREPDMSYIEMTCEAVAPHMRKGQMVCLESTTYPGTTEEVMLPILEKGSGLKAGDDFYLAYSPEREDPCNAKFSTSTIPKVVGAMTPEGLAIATALYDAVVVSTVPVSSCAAAEATKLVENIFRCVNIAMVNELKVVFHKMGIDIWEVIDAAKTKPFGFMPFYPGPGLGGHCIPIDPFYLTWKAREYDMPTKFIELAGEINTQMPYYVVQRTMESLNEHAKALRGSKLLLVGLAYKSDVDDMRESPTLKLIELYEQAGAVVDYHDPFIPEIKENREHPNLTGRKSVPVEKAGEYDAVVICTAHKAVDHDKLAQVAKLVVDTRNALGGSPSDKVRKA